MACDKCFPASASPVSQRVANSWLTTVCYVTITRVSITLTLADLTNCPVTERCRNNGRHRNATEQTWQSTWNMVTYWRWCPYRWSFCCFGVKSSRDREQACRPNSTGEEKERCGREAGHLRPADVTLGQRSQLSAATLTWRPTVGTTPITAPLSLSPSLCSSISSIPSHMRWEQRRQGNDARREEMRHEDV